MWWDMGWQLHHPVRNGSRVPLMDLEMRHADPFSHNSSPVGGHFQKPTMNKHESTQITDVALWTPEPRHYSSWEFSGKLSQKELKRRRPL